jgi:HSP20 family molecular chaperone IbpA
MATMTTMTKAQPAAERPRETPERAPAAVPPLVDIYETDMGYVVLADMPGVKADGLDVIAERDELTIRGRIGRQPEKVPNYQEFELADYYRAFTLTEDLDTDKVSAALRDGVLRVEIPKSERLRPKKIAVQTE